MARRVVGGGGPCCELAVEIVGLRAEVTDEPFAGAEPLAVEEQGEFGCLLEHGPGGGFCGVGAADQVVERCGEVVAALVLFCRSKGSGSGVERRFGVLLPLPGCWVVGQGDAGCGDGVYDRFAACPAAFYPVLGGRHAVDESFDEPTVLGGCLGGADLGVVVGQDDHNTSGGIATSTAGAATTTYVMEPDGHLIGITDSSGATYNYLYDGQGNVTGLADSAGARQATYTYDPFGNSTATGAAAALNPFRFAGGYQDTTGLYHFGERYYDPANARWTQADPSGHDRGYTYSGNNPSTHRTPPAS
jgi:RHS repeat-associated protein